MKKFLMLVVTFIMSCCCFLFAGCNEEGTYYFKSLKYEEDGTTFNFKVGDQIDGVLLKRNTFVLILEKQKECILITNEEEIYDNETYKEAEMFNGTWVEVDGTIYLQFNDYEEEAFIATKNGNTITMDMDGTIITLQK